MIMEAGTAKVCRVDQQAGDSREELKLQFKWKGLQARAWKELIL